MSPPGQRTICPIDQLAASAICYPHPRERDETLFESAMAAADAWHLERNPRYRLLWDGDARPVVPVGMLRHLDLSSAIDGSAASLQSSGTSGRALTVIFDEISMSRIRAAMLQMFRHHGYVGSRPSRFLLLSPEPRGADQPGYATAFAAFTACAPAREVTHAVDAEGKLLPELAWSSLERWAAAGDPIYIFGLTRHVESLVLAAARPVGIDAPVKIITGGGWKGAVARLSWPEIISGLRDSLRCPEFDARDLYGMTEHPLHYLSCSTGRFHLPTYSRFEIVGADGAPRPEGLPGLIRLENPFFASLPVHDLLTVDSGRWGTGCPCGDALPFLEFLGRVAVDDGACAWRAKAR